MSTRRRIAVLAAALGLLLPAGALTVAASAQATGCTAVEATNGIQIDVTPSDGSTVAASDVTISGTATDLSTRPITNANNGSVDAVRVSFQACTDGLAPPPGSGDLVTTSNRTVNFSYAPAGGFPYNGRYRVVVTASGSSTNPSGSQSATKVANVAVEAPAATPTGVKAVVGPSGVTVSWNANPEPDVHGYELWRAKQTSKTFTLVTTTTASITSVTDAVDPGEWRYVVRAIRPDADGADTVKSADSAPADASVAAPPTPTTTIAGGSSSSGGSSTTGAGTGGSTSSGSSGSGSGSGSGSTAPTRTITSTGTLPNGKVDLSKYDTLLARQQAQTTRTTEVDTGFEQTLPFKAPTGTDAEDGAQELGPGESSSPLGRLISDDGDRRRSLGLLAFGLLLFVTAMIGLFVRGEVKRADELDALEPTPDPADATDAASSPAPEPVPVPDPAVAPLPARRPRRPRPAPAPVPEPAAAAAAVAPEPLSPVEVDPEPADLRDLVPTDEEHRPLPRRARRVLPPLDSPGLDIPLASAPAGARMSHARRAPAGVPPRSRRDRPEGRAAVRPGRRGAGEGDRRVPVG